MTSIWDRYANRVTVKGATLRADTLAREKLRIRHMLEDSLSFHNVLMYEDGIVIPGDEYGLNIGNGIEQNIAIINSDNLDEKYVYSLPDEDVQIGDLFYWSDNYWLISERDANSEVYTRAKALQCNYLLKWIEVNDDEPTIIEQWCYVEDGTKYMTGELEDRHFIATRGDSRIAITISRNEHTKRFNRTCRFLVDDSESDNLLSFDLSKPLKVGHTYNDKGVYQFVLSESNSSILDNMALGIADYYQYYDKDGNTIVKKDNAADEEETEQNGKKVWL